MTTPIYIADMVPPYSCFIIGDPSADAPDARNDAALIASQRSVLAASRYKVYLRTSPDPPTVRLVLQLPAPDTAAPAGPWQDHRTAKIDCPEGELWVENISAGALTFGPGPEDRFTLADGPGRYRITVWFRGRRHPRADASPAADDPTADPALIIPEEYLIRLTHLGPLPDEDDEI